MLRTKIIHPQLLAILAQAGHGNQILVANAHYPATTNAPASATRIYLNFAPGLISVPDALKALSETLPLESATGILTAEGNPPPVTAELQALLPPFLTWRGLPRFDFYTAVNSPQTLAVIITGEQRMYTNVLLTVAPLPPE